MSKKLAPAAVVALKEALCSIYWYKADLRSFLQICISDKYLVSTLNWENYKRQIVSDLVDSLCANPEHFLGDLTRLSYAVANINSFEHLAHLDGGEQKVKLAKSAVDQLRKLVEPHQDVLLEEEAIAERQKRHLDKLRANKAVREKLSKINQRFMKLAVSEEVHTRGYGVCRATGQKRTLRPRRVTQRTQAFGIWTLFDVEVVSAIRIDVLISRR